MEKTEYNTNMKQIEKLLGKRKYPEALSLLNSMKETEKEDKEQLSEIYSKISEAFYGKEGVKTENAIANLIESLKIRSELDQPDILALEMMNLAYLQDESGSLDSAEKTLNEAMEIATEIGDITLTLSLKNALADILSENSERITESEKIYNENMKEAKKDNLHEIYYESCVSLIKLLRDSNRAVEATELSAENIKLAEKIMDSLKTKKEKEEFKDIISYLYDVSIDLAMENEDMALANELARKFTGEK